MMSAFILSGVVANVKTQLPEWVWLSWIWWGIAAAYLLVLQLHAVWTISNAKHLQNKKDMLAVAPMFRILNWIQSRRWRTNRSMGVQWKLHGISIYFIDWWGALWPGCPSCSETDKKMLNCSSSWTFRAKESCFGVIGCTSSSPIVPACHFSPERLSTAQRYGWSFPGGAYCSSLLNKEESPLCSPVETVAEVFNYITNV